MRLNIIPVSIGGIPESGLLEVGVWSKGAEGGLELSSVVVLRRNGLVPDITRKCGRDLHEGRTCARRSMTPGRGAASLKDVDIKRSLHMCSKVPKLGSYPPCAPIGKFAERLGSCNDDFQTGISL